METTADTEQEYARVAELRVDLQGEEHSLVAYRSVDSPEETLFVPFRDETTGQETDGGGRYMEFEVGEASASDASGEGTDPRAGDIHDAETVTLDFNLAYHPFCVFDDAFVCPLPLVFEPSPLRPVVDPLLVDDESTVLADGFDCVGGNCVHHIRGTGSRWSQSVRLRRTSFRRCL
jgi:hypothetical protein